MQPVQGRSRFSALGVLLVQGVRWISGVLGRSRTIEILTWLGWLASVALFALWTLYHYQPPAKPAWLGMTIRTFGFAAWMLVLREWLAIHLRFRDPQPDEQTENED